MTFRDMPRHNGMKASPIGAAKRARVQAEAAQAVTLEATFRLHRLDWWHCTIAQASQPGWPDYAVFGAGWHAFLELKARSPATNRKGKVDDGQRRYQASIERGGGEWVTFCLPDDWGEVDAWLNARTGHQIFTDGKLRREGEAR